jgi:glycosyltransferase involved in cell wall biosynthesis
MQLMLATISVALPVYNGAAYLAPQLDSILAQLETGDEIVVAYQPSTDDSRAILEDYCARDPRIRLLINEGKAGITANFQLALSQCRGDYIFLCDQDDVWLPQKRSAVLRAFEESGADLVSHNAVHTDEQLNPQQQTFFEIYPIGPGKWKNIKKPRMSGCCMAMTRAMRDRVLPLPEIYGYDQWIAVVAEFSGRITYLDEVLLLHRLHGDNSTSGTRRLSRILRCRSKLLLCLGARLLRIRLRGQ